MARIYFRALQINAQQLKILVRIAAALALVVDRSCFIVEVLFFLSWHKKNQKNARR